MYRLSVVVRNGYGLHGKFASAFIKKADAFASEIWVEKDTRRVNAKSLLGVLSLNVKEGESISIIANGPDEKSAVLALIKQASN